MEREREYQGCGDEYNAEKGKGKQYHLPYNIKALGKNIKLGKRERGRTFFRRKLRLIKKNGDGEEYQVKGIFIHPWILKKKN